MAFDFPRDQVAHDDALGVTIDNDHIEHFTAGKHLDLADGYLAHQGAVGTQKQLLARLPACIEGTRYLAPPKDRLAKSPP